MAIYATSLHHLEKARNGKRDLVRRKRTHPLRSLLSASASTAQLALTQVTPARDASPIRRATRLWPAA
jgi:hypothetical protein